MGRGKEQNLALHASRSMQEQLHETKCVDLLLVKDPTLPQCFTFMTALYFKRQKYSNNLLLEACFP